MKNLLEFLVKSIVNHPQEVKIEESPEKEITTYVIFSHPDDIKIIIGKKGRTIKCIRELVRVKAIQKRKKINIKIEG